MVYVPVSIRGHNIRIAAAFEKGLAIAIINNHADKIAEHKGVLKFIGHYEPFFFVLP